MRLIKSLSIVILCSALISGCAATSSSPPLDFGDSSIGNLWYQVTYRLNEGDPDQSLIYADKLLELYSAEAREQQASLSEYPVDKDVYNYDALNFVGQTLLIKGNVLLDKGDNAGAREAYNTLISDFSYAQMGFVGSFTKPADEAKEKLAAL